MNLLGPYLVAAGLLVVAGAAKALRPADTARALSAGLGLGWVTPGVVRAVAVVEAALGALALAWPAPLPASLVAASFLAFALVTARVRARGGPLASCGCFGTPDTPATALHVGLDLGLAASAAVVAAAGHRGPITAALAPQPLHGLALVGLSALGLYLTVVAMTLLPRLQAARRSLTGGTGSPAR